VRRLACGVFVAESVWRESSPRDRHLLITAAAARLRPWLLSATTVPHAGSAFLFR
jgi:hypothetical protein